MPPPHSAEHTVNVGDTEYWYVQLAVLHVATVVSVDSDEQYEAATATGGLLCQ